MLNLKTYAMRTKLLLFTFLLFGIFGCNKFVKEEPWISTEYADTIPHAIVSKEELPEWLNAKDIIGDRDHPTVIYKVEWKERNVYYARIYNSSCYYCHFYYENGEHISFADNSVLEDFQSTSKNWIIIYVFPEEWTWLY